MGSIEPYETKAGKRYRIRWRTPEHKDRNKRGFTTKRDAERALRKVEGSKDDGQYIDPSSAIATISDLGASWLAGQSHLKPSSLAPVEIAWRVHVEPVWGTQSVGSVRHSAVQKWVTELSERRGATTVLRAHGVLAGILETAVKDRRLASNPARGVNLPRKTKKPRRYLTHERVERLAEQSGNKATLVRFLCYTGLRWGEAVALQVGDLDMLRRRVRVERNAVRVNGYIVPGTPKSHEARSVPFPAFLVDELAAQCEGRERGDLLFGNGQTWVVTPSTRDGWFVGAKRRASESDADFPNVTIHDLRHTAASLAISAGANVKAVQRMLGHASAAMTLDTYADLFDDDLDAVASALNDARLSATVSKSVSKSDF
ncbi:site-specific integrase [Paramicrobacterium chengjingii]|uniref:Site-specific integrase n=1 Tax=Paramicrobacterium chengjingii TaxID=2769067 RepID=A0ABX6YL39_9MICO|nr:site-specific integrase [Microbacterium chengjingii]QPZ39521.1 site-specific integrase [Microbacterium chengjingii]